MTGLEEVLAAHEYALGMRRGAICSCGFVPTIEPESLRTQQDYHRDHTAAVVLAWVGERLGEDDVRFRVADVLPLGYTSRDPHANVYESAEAALAAVKTALGVAP